MVNNDFIVTQQPKNCGRAHVHVLFTLFVFVCV